MYLFSENKPINSVIIKLKNSIIRINKYLNGISNKNNRGWKIITSKNDILINNIKIGKAKNTNWLFCFRNIYSFIKTFNASAKNYNLPWKPTKKGPILRWIKLKNFRSNKGIKPPTKMVKIKSRIWEITKINVLNMGNFNCLFCWSKKILVK